MGAGAGGGGGGAGFDRRAKRLEALQGMSDEAFVAEIHAQQSAQWRSTRLEYHATTHRIDFVRQFGISVDAVAFAELGQAALRSWDRRFTEIELDGAVTYAFVVAWEKQGGILLVATREGFIRTAIPMSSLAQWLTRCPGLVEVMERAKRLGL